jgi:flagellar basal body rod protein FlgG
VSKGVYVALSGAVAQEQALEATATNVANASSAGYQRLRPVFRNALAKAVNGDNELQFAKTSRTALDVTPGAIRVTENPLDVALPKGVYLAAITPAGERYTRAGNLGLGPDGTLHTAGGATVSSDSDQPIKANVGGGQVRVFPDGSVKQGNDLLGKLKLVTFASPDALAPEGSSLLATGGAGASTPSTEPVTVGAVEDSNAQPVTAMTEMMQASRTFEAFQKVIDQFGEIDRKLLTTVPTAVE